MVDMLLRAAIIVVILSLVFACIMWAFSYAGIVVPDWVMGGVIGLVILAGALWVWRNRGSIGF
jgi:protein-S-isoprenylcysteine O-methyltransferase Ste14